MGGLLLFQTGLLGGGVGLRGGPTGGWPYFGDSMEIGRGLGGDPRVSRCFSHFCMYCGYAGCLGGPGGPRSLYL